MDIKLFVACHRLEEVPEHPLLCPIQVGAALTDARFPGFLYDDSGDNISTKNRSYCELTAQYWAWKNVNADYYGFFHYRRYLYPDQSEKRPYRIERRPSMFLLDRLGYAQFAEMISQYDLILPKSENMYIPVREHYANAPHHHQKDLMVMEQIVRERCPEYEMALEDYLSNTLCYFGNIYIMKKLVFHDYCAWLFPILEEFDIRADLNGYGQQERRVDGYLAERLLGIYAVHEKKKGMLRIAELPRVHLEPVGVANLGKRLLYYVLPPGSNRRAIVKEYVTMLRK